MFTRLKLPRFSKKDWRRDFLPATNAAIIAIFFFCFYDGNTEPILATIAAFCTFGGNIKDKIVSLFRDGVSQTAHAIVCLVLITFALYLIVPKFYRILTEKI